MDILWVIGLSVAIVALVTAAYITWVLAANRRRGISGLYRRTRLTCPKCGKAFDYDWVPGGSFSAIRLGSRRYLACPLCHRWSVFPMTDGLPASDAPVEPSPPPPA